MPSFVLESGFSRACLPGVSGAFHPSAPGVLGGGYVALLTT
jgi:hypothetical protein